MDSKVLYPIAVLIAALSGGYYYYSGKGQKLDVDASRNMTYSAKQIQLTQTDETGQLHVRAQVDSLEQDMQKKTSNLQSLKAQMYKNGQVDATFQSAQAHGYDDNAKVILSDDVIARKLMQQGEMQFSTQVLTVYPRQRLIETDQAVSIESPQARFDSQGLKADLNSGQYEFFNIRGKYEP
jgi:lipopolysaccharide export system protein LptC